MAGTNALDELYGWFKRQLSKYNDREDESDTDEDADAAESGSEDPEDSKANIVSTQKQFVEKQVWAILGGLDVGLSGIGHLITVRKKFCNLHNYLRPVFAEPIDLNRYLSEPAQQVPFDFNFGRDGEGPFAGVLAKKILNDNFLCVHKVASPGSSAGPEGVSSFPERINRFWRKMSASPAQGGPGTEYRDFPRRIAALNEAAVGTETLYCAFAGTIGHDEKGGEPQLQDIFAAYFVQDSDWCPDGDHMESALRHVTDLFKGLELIAELDSKLFELQGLRIMANLLPQFVDEEKPRSDKISIALKLLRDKMKQHLVGRPEWENGEEPKLFYLSASFEENGKDWIPRLEMYPQAYRNRYPLASLLVSHADVPSASKFLLKSYLDAHWAKFAAVKEGHLDPSFIELLSASRLGLPDVEGWQARVIRGRSMDCLYMVEHDAVISKLPGDAKNEPWKIFNHPADRKGQVNRSLLAFVVEGERDKTPAPDSVPAWAFPRGILAFESGAIDAFSDRDIEALRKVAKAFSSLIRLITHHNACLEYRTKLSRAFDAELYGIAKDEDPAATALWRKFIFSVRKIDGEQLHELIDQSLSTDQDKEYIRKLLNLSSAEIETLIGFKDHIKSIPNAVVSSPTKANRIVADRVDWAINLVREIGASDSPEVDILTGGVVEFLSACTENFQWAAYLSSIAQALGDRAAETVPDFQMMTPGYSASRMFMASVWKELRQVVKLSEFSKLSKERENYKKFVRYRLVNSARMPGNGFSFDGMGWVEKKDSSEKYGALVSDLISAAEKEGDEPIKTFVTLLCECIVDADEDPNLRMQILHGINGLFKHGTTLWREDSPPHEIGNFGAFIRSVSRLPRANQKTADPDHPANMEHDTRVDTLHAALDSYRIISRRPKIEERLLDLLFKPPQSRPNGKIFAEKVYQISHGDLNARNLTWSSALTTFLMIDFEHVGRGYLGHDQSRLWLNSICDLYGEARNEVVDDDKLHHILSAIDDLIEETGGFLGDLVAKAERAGHSVKIYIEKYFEEGYNSSSVRLKQEFLTPRKVHGVDVNIPDYFVTFFVSLFLNFEDFRGSRGLLVYSFYCNALKEFEYSYRDIDRSRLEYLLNKLPPLDRLKSTDIHEVLMENDDQFVSLPTASLYFRHLTAARLLTIASKAASDLQVREVRQAPKESRHEEAHQ